MGAIHTDADCEDASIPENTIYKEFEQLLTQNNLVIQHAESEFRKPAKKSRYQMIHTGYHCSHALTD